jgi:crotonobetainyl-CoA:carnitine CoA-transferase CaiB-like acyl-CoA transferase
VHVGLYEPFLRMLDELIPVYGATGHVRERIGSGTEYVVPHNHYRTRDGRWIAIACTNDRMFERLVRAIERPELSSGFATMADRLASRDKLDELIGAWVGAVDAAEALRRLDRAEVPSALVHSVKDLFEDPQVKARENITSLPNPLGGLLHMAGTVPRLSATPGVTGRPGPVQVGEHNEQIYCERLGLRRDELEALRASGVI